MLLHIIITLEVCLFLWIGIEAVRAGAGYKQLASEYGGSSPFRLLTQGTLAMIDRLKLHERFALYWVQVHRRVVMLYGSKPGIVGQTKWIAANTMLAMTAIFLTVSAASLLDNGNWAYFACAAVFAGATPMLVLRGLDMKIHRKRTEILLELPEFLNKLMLLVNAGETVLLALHRCIEHKQAAVEAGHPLYIQLHRLLLDVSGGQPFQQALEELSRRCGVQEISYFSTTVLLNMRRGGEDFALALKELSHNLWERRKAVTRTLGEEASSKLIFPMMIQFIAVLIVVASPAIFLMGG